MAHDLPGGARRFIQEADGYVATVVAGQVTPGRSWVRTPALAPASQVRPAPRLDPLTGSAVPGTLKQLCGA